MQPRKLANYWQQKESRDAPTAKANIIKFLYLNTRRFGSSRKQAQIRDLIFKTEANVVSLCETRLTLNVKNELAAPVSNGQQPERRLLDRQQLIQK